MNREFPEIFKQSCNEAPVAGVDCTTILLIAAAALFFLFLFKKRDRIKTFLKKTKSKVEKMEEEEEGFSPAPFVSLEKKVQEPISSVCHKSCCCETQWPVPIDANDAIAENALIGDFEKSPVTCHGCNGSGCLCLKKDQLNSFMPTCSGTRV